MGPNQPMTLENLTGHLEDAIRSFPLLSPGAEQLPVVGGNLGLPHPGAVHINLPALNSTIDPHLEFSADSLIPNSVDPAQIWLGTSPAGVSNSQAPILSSSSPPIPKYYQNRRPICSHCGRRHSRPVRDRACHDGHTHQYRFPCRGACGDPDW